MTALLTAWRMQSVRVLTSSDSTESQRALARRFLAQHEGS